MTRLRLPGRRDAMCVSALLAVSIALWLPRLQGPIDLRWDAAAYYELGTSLATGNGYRLLHEPGQIQSTLHAPMLPVFVAMHELMAGTTEVAVVGVWLRHSYMALFLAYAVAVYALMRRFLGAAPSLVATLLVVLQLQLVFLSDLYFPELPYALVTVLCALCLTSPTARRRSWPAALFAALAFAIRTVGVALLVAWIVDSVSRRMVGQTLIRVAVSVSLVLAWGGYIAWVESGPEYRAPAYAYQRADYAYINVSYQRNLRYVDSFRPELGFISIPGRLTRLLGNLVQLPKNIAEAVSTQHGFLRVLRSAANERLPWPILGGWFDVALFGVASILIGVGAVVQLARGQPFIVSYVTLALLVVYSTPWPAQFNRYVSPLAPFLVLFLFTGAMACFGFLTTRHWLPRRIVAISVSGFIAILLLAQLGTLTLLYGRLHTDAVWLRSDGTPLRYRLFFHDGASVATDAALDWLKSHARADSVVAATIPPYAYLRAGVTSVLPPLEADANRAQQLIDSVPVSLMIVDHGDFRRYTTGMITSFSDEWRRVYRAEGPESSGEYVEIYERVGRRHPGGARVR